MPKSKKLKSPKNSAAKSPVVSKKSDDRRQYQRYDASLSIQVRLMQDGAPIEGQAVEIGPNGMRVLCRFPLIEASFVLINFQTASNGTNCEGRVVWTQKSDNDSQYESGIDIQKWGGNIPESPKTIDKKAHLIQDRRKKPR